MPRIHFLLCCGVGVLNAVVADAQGLPKNPTPQQTVGYQMQQQKIWNTQQLPKNSVLFKSDYRYSAWQSREFNFKKEKKPAINFPSRLFPVQDPAMRNTRSFQSLPLPQSNLFQQKKLFNQWRKQSWWKDPAKANGCLLLRDFLINSKGQSNYYL